MESLLWAFRTYDSFTLVWPIALGLFVCIGLTQVDTLLLLGRRLAMRALGRRDAFERSLAERDEGSAPRPSGLVVIPSLLRNRDDLSAITTTIESCGTNGYPSELVIIAAVDGIEEQPALVRELKSWVEAQAYPGNVHVYVTGTCTRLGKMMAVEAGVEHMRELVTRRAHAAFPEVYFSIDGDGTLGDHALERLVARLVTPHPLTGNPRRVVSGKICIRPDVFWGGWRRFFSVEGQLTIQVAREFIVSNVTRHNWKLTPAIGIPGALYCTWSDVIIQAPRYMAFMQSIRFVDAVRWWAGRGAPLFSKWKGHSLPEALTGASDDTCIAFIASIARWQGGKLSFDAPPTPLHAVVRFFRGMFFERSHDYEPEARVYTYTPPTLGGLWKQRVRWNSSRFECAGRFWRSFWFHWEIGLPVVLQLSMILRTVFEMTLYYVVLPYYCFGGPGNALVVYVLGYVFQTIAYAIYTVIGLLLEREWRMFWRTAFALPLASAYCIGINFFGCVVGVVRDLFLFGNTTNFAPEWTLAKGGCHRVALAFRLRRFFVLLVRSLVHGDVPLGTFWLGWQETPWTPSGFEGWTTGKPQRSMLPRPLLRRESLRTLKGAATVGAVIAVVAFIQACRVQGGDRSVAAARVVPSSGPSASPETALALAPPRHVLGARELCITSGRAGVTARDGARGSREPSLAFLSDTGEVRASVAGMTPSAAELRFLYGGPSTTAIPLSSGELRRQVGLKLRGQDDCNIVYVMWHFEPTHGVFVSLKRNPGAGSYEECGPHGYTGIEPLRVRAMPTVHAGEEHTMRAELDGLRLRVTTDGEEAWIGDLPEASRTFDGPVGLRIDNVALSFDLAVDDATRVATCPPELQAPAPASGVVLPHR